LAFEFKETFAIIQISEISVMSQVRWNVTIALSERHNVLAERVGNPGFVEDVRILAREVTYNDVRP
jgi:hypothetical protein